MFSQERPWLVYTCGAMGAGKGHAMSWLSEHGLFKLENVVHIDPDHFKNVRPDHRSQPTINHCSQPTINHCSQPTINHWSQPNIKPWSQSPTAAVTPQSITAASSPPLPVPLLLSLHNQSLLPVRHRSQYHCCQSAALSAHSQSRSVVLMVRRRLCLSGEDTSRLTTPTKLSKPARCVTRRVACCRN